MKQTIEYFLKEKVYQLDERQTVNLTNVYQTQKENTTSYPLQTDWDKQQIGLMERKKLKVQTTAKSVMEVAELFQIKQQKKACMVSFQTYMSIGTLPFVGIALPSGALYQETTMYWSLPVSNKKAMNRFKEGKYCLYVPMAMRVKKEEEWLKKPMPFSAIIGNCSVTSSHTSIQKEELFFQYFYHVLSIAKYNRQAILLLSCKELDQMKLPVMTMIATFHHWFSKEEMNEAFRQVVFCDCDAEWKESLALLQM